MATKKDFQALIASAQNQGWRIEPTRSGHLKWYAPTGPGLVISGSTESDARGIKNHLARIRRLGYTG